MSKHSKIESITLGIALIYLLTVINNCVSSVRFGIKDFFFFLKEMSTFSHHYFFLVLLKMQKATGALIALKRILKGIKTPRKTHDLPLGIFYFCTD